MLLSSGAMERPFSSVRITPPSTVTPQTPPPAAVSPSSVACAAVINATSRLPRAVPVVLTSMYCPVTSCSRVSMRRNTGASVSTSAASRVRSMGRSAAVSAASVAVVVSGTAVDCVACVFSVASVACVLSVVSVAAEDSSFCSGGACWTASVCGGSSVDRAAAGERSAKKKAAATIPDSSLRGARVPKILILLPSFFHFSAFIQGEIPPKQMLSSQKGMGKRQKAASKGNGEVSETTPDYFINLSMAWHRSSMAASSPAATASTMQWRI